jgi:molybdopterin-containing oxidoreductase family membrane subunit
VRLTTKPAELHLLQYEIPLAPRPLVRSFVHEVRSMPVALQAWFGLLLALLGVMAIAAVVSIPPGWEVFGTTPTFEWGLMIIGYVFFAIMTSGLCLASSLGTVFGIERFQPFEKRHAILAVLSLTTAFLIIALDLHYPVRMVFGAMLVPSPTSPMWWMGVFYGIYLVVLLVEVWSMFTPHPKIHQYACTTAAVVAILAPATLGAVFGVLYAKAFWNGIWTPILMVASAFLAGTALLGIVFYLVHRLRLADFERAAPIAIPSVRLLLVVGLALVGALVARQVFAGFNDPMRGLSEATEALVAGPLAWQFWLRVVGGLVVPALIVVTPLGRRPGAIFTAGVLILGGILLDRFLFVAAGQIAPQTAGAGTISYPYAPYTPTPVELAILVGAGAFMALLYTLAERYLDMGETDTHVFFGFPWIKRHDDAADRLADDAHVAHPDHPGQDHAPVEGLAAGVPAGAPGTGS